MIESRDASWLNRVMNDPSVYPDISLGHKDYFDATEVLKNPRNHFFANEYGGFLVMDKGDGVYEVHTQFLPGGRGKAARESAREAMEQMFLTTDCMALTTFCPSDNKKAINLALFAGMHKRQPETYFGVQGHMYSITVKEWLCQPQSL